MNSKYRKNKSVSDYTTIKTEKPFLPHLPHQKKTKYTLTQTQQTCRTFLDLNINLTLTFKRLYKKKYINPLKPQPKLIEKPRN